MNILNTLEIMSFTHGKQIEIVRCQVTQNLLNYVTNKQKYISYINKKDKKERKI